MADPIRVMIVDDHDLVRRGLRSLLELEPDLEVVGEAGTAGMALSVADDVAPDVVVLDVRLPDGSGVEVCRALRQTRPATRALMLTSFSDDEALFAAILAGASGFLLKEVRDQDLVGAIRRIAAGESLLDPAVTEKVLHRIRAGEREDPLLSQLTEQEQRILELVTQGMTNRQIAEEAFLAEKTVKNYVSSILSKLGMSRRTEAAVYYQRHLDES